MLRRRMGDDRFLEMLANFRRRYEFQAVTTEQFRAATAEGLPPQALDPRLESFFDQWIYGTGIPSFKMAYKVTGKAPNLRVVGTVTQGDVPEDFSALVPVEIQVPKSRTITQWVRTASEPATFSVPVRQIPSKVVLDPNNSVLHK